MLVNTPIFDKDTPTADKNTPTADKNTPTAGNAPPIFLSLTALEQAYAHGRHLEDVFVITEISRVNSRRLCTESAVIEFHNLLSRLQNLKSIKADGLEHL